MSTYFTYEDNDTEIWVYKCPRSDVFDCKVRLVVDEEEKIQTVAYKDCLEDAKAWFLLKVNSHLEEVE